jgi:3-(methylthio)propanoyl-CoA dehydrogenase
MRLFYTQSRAAVCTTTSLSNHLLFCTMNFRAPLQDLLFTMRHVADIDALARCPAFAEAGYDTAKAVLEECAKFNEHVLAPLNALGDKQPSHFNAHDQSVTTSPGFQAAFKQFSAGGWQGLQHPIEYEGQGLPKLMGAACAEILNAANMSFALCPLLTDGAIEALLTAGSALQKQTYLPKLITGQWTGTMNLTESQAGSDLATVRTQAVAQQDADHTYRIRGQKIFITYGEHDMADNIIHLVLARTPDAPAGVKGISLFIVPKFLHATPNNPAQQGLRNDVFCASLEHKLGIKASPTAVMIYGEKGIEQDQTTKKGAIAYLVGEENRGLEYMFIMMNSARYAVGIQGIALAQRAYQAAVDYAKQRVQGRSIDGCAIGAPIIHHPDVRRMLLTMRSLVEACRAMALNAGSAYDLAHHHNDETLRTQQQTLYEFMVPLVKTYSTEMSLEVTSLAIQVHGGMGFIEETGVAQYYRDAKILTIYEGTSAIQANDFIARKTLRDQGSTAHSIIVAIQCTQHELMMHANPSAQIIAKSLADSLANFTDALAFVLRHGKQDAAKVYAGGVPYVMLAGNVIAGWQLARAALAALNCPQGTDTHDAEFMRAKVATTVFYAQHILPRTQALRDTIVYGSESVTSFNIDDF